MTEITHFNGRFSFFSALEKPVEKALGQQVYKLCGSGRKRRCVLTSESSFYYIPILSTLQHVLEREDVLQYVLPERRARARENLEDFSDGAAFQNHPLFSSNLSALQIIGYYDELEICNPLGSAAKIHKLGIFLFTIANLPPKYLFALAKASDVKKYTPDSILAPFVADIKTLSSDGMTASLRDKTLNCSPSWLIPWQVTP